MPPKGQFFKGQVLCNGFLKYLIYFFLLAIPAHAHDMPRRMIAFWDSSTDLLSDSIVPRVAEMVLNHLGIDVIYFDIMEPLPDLSNRTDVCGILICFVPGTVLPDPLKLIDWSIDAIDRGIKVIITGSPGISQAPLVQQNRLYKKLGFVNLGRSVPFTFDYKILQQDNQLIPFEKKYPENLPPFEITQIQGEHVKSYLRVGTGIDSSRDSDLIIMGPAGAYVNSKYDTNYDLYLVNKNPTAFGWYINPFLFFKMALGLSDDPIPDTTTLAGRRIFYSICHGDAWNVETSVAEFRKKEGTLSSEVLLEKVIIPNPDIPISMGIIAADIDPNWVAKKNSRAVALRYIQTPQVEVASHTYSHPFDWEFFAPGNNGKKLEINYLQNYPYSTWGNSYLSWFHAQFSKAVQSYEGKKNHREGLRKGYVIPRAYANQPFDINLEIAGSIDFINELAVPAHNPVKLLLWSGDGLAWGDAVVRCYRAGVKNLGVGSARLDADYPSYVFVGPIGRKPSGVIQIYNSSNGDNEYTYEWTKDFYRFAFLQNTLKNTGEPIRVKPMCVYYHSFSGQFEASVNAILSNLEYVRSQSPISIQASRFCEIAEGFYSVKINKMGNSKWKIQDRKGLQTLRFDDARNMQIDVSRSVGVLGYVHSQDVLYVYLDAAVKEPIITTLNQEGSSTPYLVDSSWEIWDLRRENNALHFHTKGWGKLQMKWYMPQPGTYSISHATVSGRSILLEATTESNILSIELELPFNEVEEIFMEKIQ